MIGSVLQVTSLDDIGLSFYRTLRRPHEHRKAGLFVAEGTRVVERFLESPLEAISVLLTQTLFDRYRPLIECRGEAITVYIAEKKLLETIVGFECHQGIMAIGKVPLPPPINELLATLPRPHLLAAVDNLTSAENTGVLVRNCAACGVNALIVGETSADPYLRRSVRNSMGTIFRLPVLYADTLTKLLSELRERHAFQIVAAHPQPQSEKLFDADFLRDTCIVFGNEGDGISKNILAECTASVAIPMAPGVDSFNVACASAVVLYEAMRQRMGRHDTTKHN
jgi:tRNA G18 (ribose-2'-O)-methylase SpoU